MSHFDDEIDHTYTDDRGYHVQLAAHECPRPQVLTCGQCGVKGNGYGWEVWGVGTPAVDIDVCIACVEIEEAAEAAAELALAG